MKKPFIVVLLLITCFLFLTAGGCSENATDKVQTQQTEQLLAEAQAEVGMPNITNFQQRKLMKMIYELQDQENLICYAYIKSDYQGKLVFIGKCLGYGVPFSAQFTNPERTIYPRYRNSATLPQADPNGLFMPTSSSATWLMMLDKDAQPRLVYLEPEIVVSPFPLN